MNSTNTDPVKVEPAILVIEPIESKDEKEEKVNEVAKITFHLSKVEQRPFNLLPELWVEIFKYVSVSKLNITLRTCKMFYMAIHESKKLKIRMVNYFLETERERFEKKFGSKPIWPHVKKVQKRFKKLAPLDANEEIVPDNKIDEATKEINFSRIVWKSHKRANKLVCIATAITYLAIGCTCGLILCCVSRSNNDESDESDES